MSERKPSTYFVTGASGVVGSAFVARVFQDARARAVILLRPKRGESALSRFDALLNFWGIEKRHVAVRERIRFLEGDVSAPQLGLDDTAYDSLACELTHIVHSAAVVKMNLPIEQARSVAVGGARQISMLAERARPHRLRKIEFISTVGVHGRRSVPLTETWVDAPRSFHNTYEQAKAEAEQVARDMVERGLPLTVWRPSMVVGETKTGKIIHHQVFYYLCDFLSGVRTRGVFPSFAGATLDLVAVDELVEALWWSSRHAELNGRVMHACSSSRAISLELLRARVQGLYSEAGRRVALRVSLPPRAFVSACHLAARIVPRRHRGAFESLPVFLAYLEEKQRFNNRETVRLMAQAGLGFSDPIDYLDTVVRAYLRKTK